MIMPDPLTAGSPGTRVDRAPHLDRMKSGARAFHDQTQRHGEDRTNRLPDTAEAASRRTP